MELKELESKIQTLLKNENIEIKIDFKKYKKIKKLLKVK